ncbi:putative bifunctional diguanylate cyclase/phosphodiesterase [Streptomyces harbinensis]|uniref:putative bifunctional diguanylate cyclase/phosphodiesterase n=1 Tax=Streptomyces harbinensis TaxID=1176198 RepID=UPI003F4A55ED
MNGPIPGPGDPSGGTQDSPRPPVTERDVQADDRAGHLADYRAAFRIATLPMALIDPAGRIGSANTALETLLGYAPGALAGLPADAATGLDLGLDGDIRGPYHAVLSGRREQLRCTRRLKHADGHAVWAEVTVRPTGHGGGALLSVLDVTERRELREKLWHLQMHDPVTRLPNRSLFVERLTAALGDSATGRIGLCYLDLDGFKAINDTHGHRVGDELLAAAAQRLTHCTAGATGSGPLVARLGGDEFAVLVDSSAGTDQLARLAEAMLTALQRPFEVAGQRLSVSASIGVVERECAGLTATSLMQAADTTLYWAKADGKARWTLFDPERNAHRMTRQSLTATLRPAIERGEFVLEYQPIVSLADDTLRGVEALVRWQHPRFGRLTPDRFIGLAEENGAIVPLGRWVLTEAVRQARAWQLAHQLRPAGTAGAGPPPFVSVNVAVRQMWDSDVVADVTRVLGEIGLPAGLLQLELTESAVMGPAGRPLQALQELSEMGVRIAIDDFGTGYSNLAYLSQLPVRALKLDGTFVKGFRTARHLNPADETIVTALVDLAHKLGLTVTAECVEGQAQADRLRRIGCDTGQGWLYAKPLPPEQITAMIHGVAGYGGDGGGGRFGGGGGEDGGSGGGGGRG